MRLAQEYSQETESDAVVSGVSPRTTTWRQGLASFPSCAGRRKCKSEEPEAAA